MGNQNGKSTKTMTIESKPSNRVARTGMFHGLEMLAKASDFVMKKRSCISAMDSPPFKRLRLSKRKRKVHFNETVKVEPIEHHSWYTEEERHASWRSLKEIRAHAKRNSIEMNWEGKDWENAAEESDFFFDIKHQVRFHPCWTTPRLNAQHGQALYGSKMQEATHHRMLGAFIKRYGITAFVEE